jgi:hypothetical protein
LALNPGKNEEGDKMLVDMRNEQIDKDLELRSKKQRKNKSLLPSIDFRPTADELIAMTPS